MIATRKGKTISIGRDFADCVTMGAGWNLDLHALPGFAFRVSLSAAPTADDAQRIAAATVRRERPLTTDAATIQRF